MDPDEAWEIADSLEIEEFPNDAGLRSNQDGQVVAHRADDGGWMAVIVRKPGLSLEQKARFDRWARERVAMILITGHPEIDGWFRRKSDSGWQITSCAVAMPPDPFKDSPARDSRAPRAPDESGLGRIRPAGPCQA